MLAVSFPSLPSVLAGAVALGLGLVLLLALLAQVWLRRALRQLPEATPSGGASGSTVPLRVDVVVPVHERDVATLPTVLAAVEDANALDSGTKIMVVLQDLSPDVESVVTRLLAPRPRAEVVSHHSRSDGRAFSRVAIQEREHSDVIVMLRPAHPLSGRELAACLGELSDPTVGAVQPVAGAGGEQRLRQARGVAVLEPTSHVVRASALWAAGGWRGGTGAPEADLSARMLARGSAVRLLDLGADARLGTPPAAATRRQALVILRRAASLVLPAREGSPRLGRAHAGVLAGTALATLTRPGALVLVGRELCARLPGLPAAVVGSSRRLVEGVRAGDRLALGWVAALVPALALLVMLPRESVFETGGTSSQVSGEAPPSAESEAGLTLSPGPRVAGASPSGGGAGPRADRSRAPSPTLPTDDPSRADDPGRSADQPGTTPRDGATATLPPVASQPPTSPVTVVPRPSQPAPPVLPILPELPILPISPPTSSSAPTERPSERPTERPSERPSDRPSDRPSERPSDSPTRDPEPTP